ncbi:aspartyl protease [Anseongella ginsenosidimutans]|uniref:Aspartyl protease n=1 Tax=Anseongella ginsenosidimutans TaxID=496056 RepID=A0A4V2UTN8_9SPHI|nr:retropepsin-like aspartic protease [Anseongella ginsenosidimutans]QEC52345.1 clan AA aspartic protease [Anseongella ginsenosidimutans]TCS86912.1 aspartyl protease [Anseongella ginsenosidimutans]
MISTTIALNIFSLEGDGFHPKLEISINGRRETAILDTGASKTAFDMQLLSQLLSQEEFPAAERLSTGLGTNSMQCFTAVIAELKVGDFCIPDFEVAVLDLSHINQAYQKLGLEQVLGVIGSDLLHEYKALIDYESQTLTLRKTEF